MSGNHVYFATLPGITAGRQSAERVSRSANPQKFPFKCHILRWLGRLLLVYAIFPKTFSELEKEGTQYQ